MNTIPEVINESTSAMAETIQMSEVLHTVNGGIIFSSSTSSSSATTITSTHAGSQKIGATSTPKPDENGNAYNPATNTEESNTNGISTVESLNIIGHLKSIEQINEKRRHFLSSTCSEERSTSPTDHKIFTVESKRIDTINNNNGESTKSAIGNGQEEHVTSPEDFNIATPSGTPYATPQSLRTPTSPAPPKPPMLSRTRSLPRSASLTSEPKTPVQKLPSSLAAASTTTTGSTVTITSTVVAEPQRVTTVQLHQPPPKMEPMQASLQEETAETEQPVLRNSEPLEVLSQPQLLKPISANHYERIIDELKCPGCAFPMKAPVLLCKTGHSICGQCTRVLMMCPLCKEPFTNIRSLTVEALCSKAHFRCANISGGCTVRLQHDLLSWHEKQCIYKPMKCFMGRVWGDCNWSGREAYWKDHLEAEHGNKVFRLDCIDLIWNMGVKQKPLTGYYVFEVFDEMFNFYEVYDRERVLFTMTVTSTMKEKKYNFAYEVTMLDRDSDAISITQKFPVHSEYDNDILQEGTCVSISLSDLAKFIDADRLLHYRVHIVEIKTPRKPKAAVRHSCPPNGRRPIDFQQTQIEGVNLKNVPTDVIVTRKLGDFTLYADDASSASPSIGQGAAYSSEDEVEKVRRRYNERRASECESDPELDAFIAKRWGTPQLHFNRKYLRNAQSDISSEDGISQQQHAGDKLGELGPETKKPPTDDRVSISSTSTNYRKRMTNTLRRSMRNLRVDFKALTTKKSGDRPPDTA